MKNKIKIDAYIEELVREFSGLNELRIKRFMQKYKQHIPEDHFTFWGIVHKVVTGNTKFPMAVRIKSKKWLTDNNFTPWDDGDVPV